jgi:uncharacterized protein (TIGR02246 family)
MSSQPASTNDTNNEAQIRAVIDSWMAAFKGRDLDAMMAHYPDDVQVFDLKPPLRHKGLAAYRRLWEECLPCMDWVTSYELQELTIHAGDEVAFSHSLNHMSGTRPETGETDMWLRVSIGYRKIGGQWKVVHEHVSVPVHMEPPFPAAFELKP